ITAYARTFLRHNAGRPYFLWIHYMDPHDPYNPPYAYRDMPTEYAFYPAKPRISAWDPARKEPDWVKPENKIIIGPERLYAAEVRYVDDMLGSLFKLVPPSTWVIIGADHGEEFLEHGRMSHRNTFYEESIHVPLIVAGPGCVPRRISPPVSYVNLIPTLAGLTGLEPSADWQGKNLSGLIWGQDIPGWERPCFAGCNDATVVPPSVMVVEGDTKLILNLVDASVELYDLSEDPKEHNNLAAQGVPPEAASLKSKAEAWVEDVTESHRKREAPPPLDAEQSEKLRQQFEALGYL
ncbi:MAG: sulfatase-like hydrolase/transferase, partial [Candidatus Hydrogenedentes bacterium]|nr:sulfatase-like hydrolase/transferase [Candidatus Hydrogenedentota bacterium]